jgi:hypothetical protein
MLSCRDKVSPRLCNRDVQIVEYSLPSALIKRDIEAYVKVAVATRVDDHDLLTGDPGLIERIEETLLNGAEEMCVFSIAVQLHV